MPVRAVIRHLYSWHIKQMTLMEKVLSKMTAGLIFIWTHKLIQADVVRLMASLGKFAHVNEDANK